MKFGKQDAKASTNKDIQGNTHREIAEARAHTRAMYSYQHELIPKEDQDIFSTTLDERINQSNPAALVNWVDTNWTVVQQMVSDARAALRRHLQDIRQFLPRLNRQQPPESQRQTTGQKQAKTKRQQSENEYQ